MSQADVKRRMIEARKKTAAELQALGYDVLPSEANKEIFPAKTRTTAAGVNG